MERKNKQVYKCPEYIRQDKFEKRILQNLEQDKKNSIKKYYKLKDGNYHLKENCEADEIRDIKSILDSVSYNELDDLITIHWDNVRREHEGIPMDFEKYLHLSTLITRLNAGKDNSLEEIADAAILVPAFWEIIRENANKKRGIEQKLAIKNPTPGHLMTILSNTEIKRLFYKFNWELHFNFTQELMPIIRIYMAQSLIASEILVYILKPYYLSKIFDFAKEIIPGEIINSPGMLNADHELMEVSMACLYANFGYCLSPIFQSQEFIDFNVKLEQFTKGNSEYFNTYISKLNENMFSAFYFDFFKSLKLPYNPVEITKKFLKSIYLDELADRVERYINNFFSSKMTCNSQYFKGAMILSALLLCRIYPEYINRYALLKLWKLTIHYYPGIGILDDEKMFNMVDIIVKHYFPDYTGRTMVLFKQLEYICKFFPVVNEQLNLQHLIQDIQTDGDFYIHYSKPELHLEHNIPAPFIRYFKKFNEKYSLQSQSKKIKKNLAVYKKVITEISNFLYLYMINCILVWCFSSFNKKTNEILKEFFFYYKDFRGISSNKISLLEIKIQTFIFSNKAIPEELLKLIDHLSSESILYEFHRLLKQNDTIKWKQSNLNIAFYNLKKYMSYFFDIAETKDKEQENKYPDFYKFFQIYLPVDKPYQEKDLGITFPFILYKKEREEKINFKVLKNSMDKEKLKQILNRYNNKSPIFFKTPDNACDNNKKEFPLLPSVDKWIPLAPFIEIIRDRLDRIQNIKVLENLKFNFSKKNYELQYRNFPTIN